MSLATLARAYHNNTQSIPYDGGRCNLPMGVIVPYTNETTGNLEDHRRLLFHPSFREVEGEGFYEYAYNPNLTINWVYHAARRMDVATQKTISSNITTVQAQAWEDAIIQEVWLGGSKALSTLNEMFHVFYAYWNETPAVGECIGWCPFDLTTDRFLVQIVSVDLGGPNYEYREVRDYVTANRSEAFLDAQLTLSLKLVRPTFAPEGTIVFTGV